MEISASFMDEECDWASLRPNRQKFKKIRVMRLMSVSRLAKTCGLSKETVRRFEQGRPMQLHTIRKLIKGLEMTIEEAFKLGLLERLE